MTTKKNYCVNWKQQEKIKNVIFEMMKKNELYKKEDFEQAWQKFLLEQEKIKKEEFVMFLSAGNLKIGYNIGIFDLPSVMTCAYNCKKCYAKKSERIYKNTRQKRMRMLLHIYYAIINSQYKNKLIKNMVKNCMLFPIIRIHSSGDFFHEKYLNFWLQVITQCKKTRFYTYSKILNNNKIDYINNTYKNFNIVKSLICIDNETFLNFGKNEYIKELEKKLKAKKEKYFICDYQNMEKHACMITCKKCLNCSCVLFHEH